MMEDGPFVRQAFSSAKKREGALESWLQ